jgi:hypothetical protein
VYVERLCSCALRSRLACLTYASVVVTGPPINCQIRRHIVFPNTRKDPISTYIYNNLAANTDIIGRTQSTPTRKAHTVPPSQSNLKRLTSFGRTNPATALTRLIDEGLVNVRNHTTTRNGGFDEGIQFFVTTNGQLQMPRRDTLHFEIFTGIPREFEHFGGQILQDRRGIYSCRCTNAMALMDGMFEEAMHTTDGELQTGLGGSRLRRLFGGRRLAALASLTTFASFSGLE